MRKNIVIFMLMFMILILSSCKSSPETITIPGELFGNFDGKEMTLDDVRELAQKGDNLMFEELRTYKGMNVSSNMSSYIMLYGVEDGYRLIVNSAEPTGKPSRADFESIWESGGSGIDIRYNDVDDFILTNPSHPALTVHEMKKIAQEHMSREVTVIELEWWEYADEFPHHSKDPAKQKMRESLDAIDEPLELFVGDCGTFIAINRKTGTVYIATQDTGGNVEWINP